MPLDEGRVQTVLPLESGGCVILFEAGTMSTGADRSIIRVDAEGTVLWRVKSAPGFGGLLCDRCLRRAALRLVMVRLPGPARHGVRVGLGDRVYQVIRVTGA